MKTWWLVFATWAAVSGCQSCRKPSAGSTETPPFVGGSGAFTSPRPSLPADAADVAAPGLALVVDGEERERITSDELALRPSTLEARDRRGWLLSEVLGDEYADSQVAVRAITEDGAEYNLRDDGASAGTAMLVRRDSGELYIGWLAPGGDPATPLADRELPAQRIEHVRRIELTRTTPAAALPPAAVVVSVDGTPRATVTPSTFGQLATVTLHESQGAVVGIDLGRAFGNATVVSFEAGGVQHDDVRAPTGKERVVLYMNRRGRFKLGFVDETGRLVRGSKEREVTGVGLRSARK